MCTDRRDFLRLSLAGAGLTAFDHSPPFAAVEQNAELIGKSRPAVGLELIQHAATIRGAGRALSPAAQTAWGAVESDLVKVAQAFNLPSERP